MATQAAQSETDKKPAIPAPAAGDGPLKGLLFSAAFLLIAARLAIPAAMALWPDAAPPKAPLVLPAAAEAPAEERPSGESAASAGFGFLARLSALG